MIIELLDGRRIHLGRSACHVHDGVFYVRRFGPDGRVLNEVEDSFTLTSIKRWTP